MSYKQSSDDKLSAADIKAAEALITTAWLKTTKAEIKLLKHPEDCEYQEITKHASGCFLGTPGDCRIFSVFFEPLDCEYDPDVVVGANVTRWKFVPKQNVFVDHAITAEKTIWHVVLHELTERKLGMELGWSYDKSHQYANRGEIAWIKELGMDKPPEKQESKPKPHGTTAILPWEHGVPAKAKS